MSENPSAQTTIVKEVTPANLKEVCDFVGNLCDVLKDKFPIEHGVTLFSQKTPDQILTEILSIEIKVDTTSIKEEQRTECSSGS